MESPPKKPLTQDLSFRASPAGCWKSAGDDLPGPRGATKMRPEGTREHGGWRSVVRQSLALWGEFRHTRRQ